MTTKKDNDRLDTLSDQVKKHGWILEEKVLPAIEKMEKTLEDNMGGLHLASLLNSKIIAVVLGGIVVAGIAFVVRTGGGL